MSELKNNNDNQQLLKFAPIIALLGIILGILIIEWEYLSHSGPFYNVINEYYKSPIDFFKCYPKYSIWAMVYIIELSTLLTLCFATISMVRELYSLYIFEKGIIVLGLGVAITIILIFVTNINNPEFIKDSYKIAHINIKVYIVTVPGTLIAFLCIIGFYLLYQLIDQNIKSLDAGSKIDLEYFNCIRKFMNFFMYIIGADITIATLHCVSLQNAINNADIFPKEFTVVFGLLGSFLILIVYAPLFIKYRMLSDKLVEKIATEMSSDKEFLQSLTVKKDIREKLNLSVKFKDSIYEAIPIIAPSLGAIFPAFFK